MNVKHAHPDRHLTRLVIQTADIISDNKNTLEACESKGRLLQLLQEAQSIDDAMEQWATSVPSHWSFTRRRDASWPAEFAYFERCDTYYDVAVASIWNCYRRARLVLLDLIARTARSSVLQNEPDCDILANKAVSESRTLIKDICASVPFHLGTKTAGKQEVIYPKLEDEEVDRIHWQNATLQAMFLITLPLRRLIKLDLIEAEQHRWASLQYDRVCSIVAHHSGISSHRVAKILETAIPGLAAQPINSRHIR